MQKVTVYILAFLFTLHLTPAYFINSSFLEQFTGTKSLGYVYTLGSILSLGILIYINTWLRRFGNYRIFLGALLVTFSCYILLSLTLVIDNPQTYGPLFVALYLTTTIAHVIAFLNLDIFLEHISSDKDTGGIRGIFLTALNLAFIIGPLMTGLLIDDINNAGKVYALGAILLVPVICMTLISFRGFKDPTYSQNNMLSTIGIITRNPNLYKIFICAFILNFFYTWMVIYTPIFLHEHMGFSLRLIGTIMGLALIPFVLTQAFWGKISDKFWGQKEILTAGFLITGLSTLVIGLYDTHIMLVWIGILFMTRVGASMIEVMVETYLFKNINEKNADIMSAYRATLPLAYVVSPLVASVFLIFFDVPHMFILLGVIMIVGIRYSLTLRDTL
jgi:MFS family permease